MSWMGHATFSPDFCARRDEADNKTNDQLKPDKGSTRHSFPTFQSDFSCLFYFFKVTINNFKGLDFNTRRRVQSFGVKSAGESYFSLFWFFHQGLKEILNIQKLDGTQRFLYSKAIRIKHSK